MVVVTTAMGGGRECGRYVKGMAHANGQAVEGAGVDGAWWGWQMAEMRGDGRCGRVDGAPVESQLPSSGDQAGTLPLGRKHTRPGANTKRCFSS
jgi:hypothetical protein